MKKRILAWFLAVAMIIPTLSLPAGAAETTRFSDVSDQSTALAVESLRLMGVLDGYGDGTFRPSANLTRAQFCKMASYAMNGQNELGLYKTITIFPDVKPSHWAASYINLAAKGKAVIAGYPDGRFYPERTVTVAQAVTILLRLLGYKDEQVGGVWPDSYMAAGSIAGLTDGLNADGNAALTRGQAAKLFLNLLQAEAQAGGTLYALGEETELLSVNGGNGTMKTADGKIYSMVHPVSSTSLVGLRGRVVLSGDDALTFLPASSGGTANTAAAVIVHEDGSAVGFDELAGSNTYQIYKNGVPATRSDLRKNDVATYNPDTNSIQVCDTRISVYYESCDPTPTAPAKIKALNGTEFYVLPTARDSLAQFKPGQQMTLLLTAEGQVAAAAESKRTVAQSNAVGIVSEDRSISLLCGAGVVQLAAKAEEEYIGQAVRISSTNKDDVELTVLGGNVTDDLNIMTRTIGGTPLAENVRMFENGQQISFGQFKGDIIREDQIRYVRTNWAGEVDLVVLDRGIGEIYGRVFLDITKIPVYNDDGTPGEPEYDEKLGVEYGNNSSDCLGPFDSKYTARTGEYVAVKLNRSGTDFSALVKLTKLNDVSGSAWIGKSAVIYAGKTYEVPETVLCYNLDSEEWVSLDRAMAYSDTANLYAKDGVVRVIEVKHRTP